MIKRVMAVGHGLLAAPCCCKAVHSGSAACALRASTATHSIAAERVAVREG